MKAVIPVAGLGTRMLPMTKAIPKEMLPLVDKPLIQYIVSECAAAGVEDIVLVTHSSKNAIENHFDTSYELEATLEKRVKRTLLEEVRSICPAGVTIMSVRQGEARGLGHAILCAKPIVGEDDFIVLLPDVILDSYTADQKTENLAAMVKRFKETKASQIMLEPVALNDVSKYGIADIGGIQLTPGNSATIKAMVEKPATDLAPSNLAVVGRYVLSKSIWPLLAKTPLGAGGEIQLTDSIGTLLTQETVEAFHMSGRSHDCGDKLGYLKAVVEYTLRDEAMGKEFLNHLKIYSK
ncbi:UTP--glucose-1-phosphate uridylyltransferase GalU [Pseudoalteromonas sp. 2CM37A]|uniref:UTP--glucose-1-phosphate uridylyltransferase GalU n=1 Tax=Pseudoalteromonas sp. 2CM37A TaxID=2929853 RepID=UPI0020BD830F|nr:UTP--glucose-1-phosphate uridylyltransferase GalU [Pseudoalteromonas sp. 2CM37A]MCK8117569.1 UTP--glucose-1-phosphate uridylyltransferase GalU [Pseudoalteromonas sp. 2CM37A]